MGYGFFSYLVFFKKGVIAMRRSKMSRSGSRRNFTKYATRTHNRNVAGAPMRGGIRL